MGVDAAAAAVVPEAEFTVEVAAVCGVDVQIVTVFVSDGKAFFHRRTGRACSGAYQAGASFGEAGQCALLWKDGN